MDILHSPFSFLTHSGGTQVHLMNSTYAEVVRDVRIIMNMSDDITQALWPQMMGSMYMLSLPNRLL